jgi:hypothetical protein
MVGSPTIRRSSGRTPLRTTFSRLLSVGLATAALTMTAATVATATPVRARAVSLTTGFRLVEPAVTAPVGATALGAETASATLRFDVFLNPRDAAALNRYVDEVTAPHSLSYGEYLTRGAFAARFGASAATIAATEAVLRADGLTVSHQVVDGLGLRVSGHASTIERALATTIERYQLKSGAVGTIATNGIRVPASIRSSVMAVLGLDNVVQPTGTAVRSTKEQNQLEWPNKSHPGGQSFSAHASDIPGAPTVCPHAATATEQGYGGITDDQVAHAYGVDGLYSAGDFAANQTIAVYELEPFAMSDVAAFDECYFGTNNTSHLSVIDVDGGPGAGYGSGESVLDIENVSALAPDAHVDVYQGSDSTSGAIDTYGQIVSSDAAKVVTTSWGECEAQELEFSPGQVDVEHLLFEQAAAQGQTVFAAAGDSGADACADKGDEPIAPYRSVLDPAGQPDVVSVGGTTAISVTDPPVEQVWNDGAEGGASGGGSSEIWPTPAWQADSASVVAKSLSKTCGSGAAQCRVTPDVSAFADEYTGITVVYGGQWGTVGGTSSSAPIWAALLAEVNDSPTCQAGEVTHAGVGFVSPLLYEVGANPTQSAQGYNDITTGNNDTFSLNDGAYAAGVGYDAASGWGTPDLYGAGGVGLASALCSDAQEATTSSVTAVSPRFGPVAGGTAVTITGQGFKTGSTVNVTGVNFGDDAAASFTVLSATQISAVTGPSGVPSAFHHSVLPGTEGQVAVTYASGHVAAGPTFSYVEPHDSALVATVLSVGPSGGRVAGGNTVAIYGTGFTGATKVTFGNVVAPSFSVKSDSLIEAVVPPEGHATCLAGSHSRASGVCQSVVVVTTHAGKSATVTPLKPLQGELSYNDEGIPFAPSNCHCEILPTLTEYDYQAAPKITRIVNLAASRAEPLSNPTFGSYYDIYGSGFSWLTLDDVAFGDPAQATNQDSNEWTIRYGEMLVFGDPDPDPSPSGNDVAVAAINEGGTSAAKAIAFGAIPAVTSLSTQLLPSAGGTELVLHGSGFTASRVYDVEFSSEFGLPSTDVLNNFTVVSNTQIDVLSPSLVPASYVVSVDSVYGNSEAYTVPLPLEGPTASYQTISYTATNVIVTYPGGAALTGSTNTTCSVAGGCVSTVTGVNLGAEADLTLYVGTQPATVTSDVSFGDTSTLTFTTPASFVGEAGLFIIFATTDNGQTPSTLAAFETYAT